MTDHSNKNHWSPFEYDKLKLLLNREKADAIFGVMNGTKDYDSLPPISIEMHLTDICNLKCPWCTDLELRKNKAALEKSRIYELFDYCAKHNIGVTIEGGGEPSVHKDFAEVIKYAHHNGVHLGLISNGVKDYSEVIPYFKWVRISIDASTQDEYKVEKGVDRFHTVIKNLATFSQARDPSKTHLGVGYVLTNRNIKNLPDFAKILNEIGVDYLYIRPVEEMAEISPTLTELLQLKEKLVQMSEPVGEKTFRMRHMLTIQDRLVKDNDGLKCVAHGLTCIIRANGEVALCEKRRHDPVVFGNLNQASFETIWNSETRKITTRKLLDAKNQQGCQTCRITSFNRMFHDLNNLQTSRFI